METHTKLQFIRKVFPSIVLYFYNIFAPRNLFTFFISLLLYICLLVVESYLLCKAFRFEPAFDNNVIAILFRSFIFVHWLKHEIGSRMSCIKIQYNSCNMQLYYGLYEAIRFDSMWNESRQESRVQYQFSCF